MGWFGKFGRRLMDSFSAVAGMKPRKEANVPSVCSTQGIRAAGFKAEIMASAQGLGTADEEFPVHKNAWTAFTMDAVRVVKLPGAYEWTVNPSDRLHPEVKGQPAYNFSVTAHTVREAAEKVADVLAEYYVKQEDGPGVHWSDRDLI